MIFGDGVGASLVRAPYCQLDVGLCVMMFLICLLAYPNVRTEPQSEIGRNRGKKNSMLVCVRLMCFYIGTAQLKKVHG